jgi:hypothetical protein
MQLQTGDALGNTTAAVINNSNNVIAAAGSDWSSVLPGYLFTATGAAPIQVQSMVAPGASASGFYELFLVAPWAPANNSAIDYSIEDYFSAFCNFAIPAFGDTQHVQLAARNWMLVDAFFANLNVGTIGSSDYETGSVVLASGSRTPAAIVFATTKSVTPPDLRIWFSNAVDGDPLEISATIIAISATGFTVKLNAAPNTANTTMHWAVGGIGAAAYSGVINGNDRDLTYAASLAIDFLYANTQEITLTGNLAITGTLNRLRGRDVRLYLFASGGSRTVSYPAWLQMTTLPTIIPSGKILQIDLLCRGISTTEAWVAATHILQP